MVQNKEKNAKLRREVIPLCQENAHVTDAQLFCTQMSPLLRQRCRNFVEVLECGVEPRFGLPHLDAMQALESLTVYSIGQGHGVCTRAPGHGEQRVSGSKVTSHEE